MLTYAIMMITMTTAASLIEATTMKKEKGKILTTEIQIHASSEKVWSVLTDFEKYPEWNPFIKSITGNPSEGNKIKARIEPPDGNGMTFRPKVLKNEPNNRHRSRSKDTE